MEENKSKEFKGEIDSPELTAAINFILDYRDGKLGNGYITTLSLAQCLVDYTNAQQRLSSVKGAGVWVKASERLPDETGNRYFLHLKRQGYIISYIGALMWKDKKKGVKGFYSIEKPDWENYQIENVFEWLDESQQSQEQLLPKEPEVALMGEQSSLTDEDIDNLVIPCLNKGDGIEQHYFGMGYTTGYEEGYKARNEKKIVKKADNVFDIEKSVAEMPQDQLDHVDNEMKRLSNRQQDEPFKDEDIERMAEEYVNEPENAIYTKLESKYAFIDGYKAALTNRQQSNDKL